jgi:hypothetical protein
VAPVDLAQAAIGPGMAVFSRYARVNEPDGSAMRVRPALALINQVLDEVFVAAGGGLRGGHAMVPGVDLDAVRELAYLLFSIAERRGWTETALLLTAWPRRGRT